MRIRRPFGKVLKEFRLKEGLSQEKLALQADMDRSYIGRLERGHKQPTIITIFQLAGAMRVRPSLMIARMEK